MIRCSRKIGAKGRKRKSGKKSGKDADLGLRVVLGLGVAADQGPALVGVDQIALVVADDAGGAGVDEGGDAGLLAGADDGGGAVDVDLLEEVVGDGGGGVRSRTGRVDDDVGLDILKDGEQAVGVRDVGLVVGDAVGVGTAVALALEVDDRDGRGAPERLVEDLVHDMVAEETIASNHENTAEITGLLLLSGGRSGRFRGNSLLLGHCDCLWEGWKREGLGRKGRGSRVAEGAEKSSLAWRDLRIWGCQHVSLGGEQEQG